MERHAREHREMFAVALREEAHRELISVEGSSESRQARVQEELARARHGEEYSVGLWKTEMANARARQAATEQEVAVVRCRSSAAAALDNARAHAENHCERLEEGFANERDRAAVADLVLADMAAQLRDEQAMVSELRDTALGMQAQVDEFVHQYAEITKRVIDRECSDVKKHEQDFVENAEALAWHEESVVTELRRELHQARQVCHGSGLAEQQQRQLESDTVELSLECLGTLRMRAVSDPFRERSLVCESSMPAVPEQAQEVCGSETLVADVGVEAARWTIPAPRDVNIADEDSSEESIGEVTDRRRAVVKPIDLGRPPTGPGFQSWLAELYVNCCAASNRSRRRTMRFLKAVEKAPTHKTLEVCSRKWERFDVELAAACFRFASGEVLRRLKMYRDTLQRRGLDVSCRAALWFVLQKYVVEAGALQQVGLSRLIGLTFSGDLGLFLDSLDKILTELVEPASEDLVSTIVVPQLREASKAKTYHSLAVDIDIFDRAATGAAERSIEFLYRCARQCLAQRP